MVCFYLHRVSLSFNEPNPRYKTEKKRREEEKKKNAQCWWKPRPHHGVTMANGDYVTMACTPSIKTGGSAETARELGCVPWGCDTYRRK